MKRKVVVGFDPGVANFGLCALDAETGEALLVRWYSDGLKFPE